MHDLDEARKERKTADRTVTIGGESFTVRASVRPEVLIDWEELDADAPGVEMLRVIDELIENLLEPFDTDPAPGDRWRVLRARDDDALTTGDILAMVRVSVGIVSGRPTTAPSPSTAGVPPTLDSSTVTSPLAAVAT